MRLHDSRLVFVSNRKTIPAQNHVNRFETGGMCFAFFTPHDHPSRIAYERSWLICEDQQAEKYLD